MLFCRSVVPVNDIIKRTISANNTLFKALLFSAKCIITAWVCMILKMLQANKWMFCFVPGGQVLSMTSVRPAKPQISLGIRPVWSESSLSAWRKLGSLATWDYHVLACLMNVCVTDRCPGTGARKYCLIRGGGGKRFDISVVVRSRTEHFLTANLDILA